MTTSYVRGGEIIVDDYEDYDETPPQPEPPDDEDSDMREFIALAIEEL